MSVTSQVARSGPFLITSLPQIIPSGFPFQNAADLLVLNTGTTGAPIDPAGVLVLGSDYTVTGGGYNPANTMQTGSVTVVSTGVGSVAVGDLIVIERNVPVNQTESYTSSGPLTLGLLEQGLDKQATISQQLATLLTGCLRFENSEFLDGTLVKSARAGNLIGFDQNGNLSFPSASGVGAVYTAGAGLALNSNQFSVLPAQSLTDLTVVNAIVGSITGNAATATKLATARKINGVDFDGTAAITVTAAAGTLTGAALPVAVTDAPGLVRVAAGTLGTIVTQNANAVNLTGGLATGVAVQGLPAPVNANDAVRLTDLNAISGGLVVRSPVVAATTANITLSGPQTIDGQSVVAGNRVLVKNQTLTQNNGIYDVAAGAWTRSTDSDTAAELKVGYYYFVSSGATQGSTGWSISTAPTTLGTDPVLFTQFNANTNYSAGTGILLSGNVFSLNPVLSGLTITGSSFAGTSVDATTRVTSSAYFRAGTGTDSGVAFFRANDGTISSVSNYHVSSADYYGTISNHPIGFLVNNSGVGFMTATGLNAMAIGQTTPAAIKGTVFSAASSANAITSKANFNLSEVDIRDYGATTGSSDNTAAINAAITAATAGQSVLIPEGTWAFTGTLSITGKNSITLRGVGFGSVLSKTGNFGNAGLDIGGGSTSVTVSNLWLQTTAGSRLGGHLVQLNGNGNRLSFCRFSNSAEFTVFAGTDASNISTSITVDNCEILGSKADGIHFGAVRDGLISNCLIRDTADDAIAVGGDVFTNASYYSDTVLITGNTILTGGSRGILLEDCQNVMVSGNYINGTVSSGIWSSTYRSTTWYNTNIFLKGNVLVNVTNSSGAGRAGIMCAYTNGLSVTENYVYNTAGSLLSGQFLCDCSQVNVRGNQFWNVGVHGIVGYDSTLTGPGDIGPAGRTFAATWASWDLSKNYFNGTQNASGIALFITAPTSGVTITNLTCTGNDEANWQGATYIAYNHVNLGKIGFNCSLEGRGISAGAGNTSVTASNNI